MDNPRRTSRVILIASLAFLIISSTALFLGHRAIRLGLTKRVYDELLSGPTILDGSRVDPVDACGELLDKWDLIRGEELSAEAFDLSLPAPLIWTQTVMLPNDTERRGQAITRIAAELQEHCGEDFGEIYEDWEQWISAR